MKISSFLMNNNLCSEKLNTIQSLKLASSFFNRHVVSNILKRIAPSTIINLSFHELFHLPLIGNFSPFFHNTFHYRSYQIFSHLRWLPQYSLINKLLIKQIGPLTTGFKHLLWLLFWIRHGHYIVLWLCPSSLDVYCGNRFCFFFHYVIRYFSSVGFCFQVAF